MSLQIQFPFEDPINYTFNPDEIVVDGDAKPKLVDETGKTYIQSFTNDSGFNYDNTKAEFVSGKLQQKDQRPTDATAGASYTNDINLNWGDGVLTGTAIGGASILNNKLDLAHSDIRYVKYNAVGNADSEQIGAIKFKYIPNYSNAPTTDMTMFAISESDVSSNSLLQLRHKSTGFIQIYISNNTNVTVLNYETPVWNPISGTQYEIELNYDITNGVIQLFIDGTQLGVTQTTTATRSNITSMIIGTNRSAIDNSNFAIEDLIVFNVVQHTADYTPGYTVPEEKYAESLVTLPSMSYSGAGSLQKYISFITTQVGDLVYSINGKFWNGMEWHTSDNSLSEMNEQSVIDTQIATLLPATDTIVKFRFKNSTTQMSIDLLTLNYTGQIYCKINPTIEINTSVYCNKIASAVDSKTITGSDEVKWVVKADTQWYYITYPGGIPTLTPTNGDNYAESNTSDEWAAIYPNWDPTGAVNVKFKAFLHSEDGSTYPVLHNLNVSYDFQGGPEDSIEKTIVYGFEKYQDASANETSVKFELYTDVVFYKANIQLTSKVEEFTPDNTGYLEANVIETDNMTGNQFYKITLSNGAIYKAQVPNQASVLFKDLPNLERVH